MVIHSVTQLLAEKDPVNFLESIFTIQHRCLHLSLIEQLTKTNYIDWYFVLKVLSEWSKAIGGQDKPELSLEEQKIKDKTESFVCSVLGGWQEQHFDSLEDTEKVDILCFLSKNGKQTDDKFKQVIELTQDSIFKSFSQSEAAQTLHQITKLTFFFSYLSISISPPLKAFFEKLTSQQIDFTSLPSTTL